jgi:hypothetical protein
LILRSGIDEKKAATAAGIAKIEGKTGLTIIKLYAPCIRTAERK